MTDYEAQSLQIAIDTYHVYFWGDVIAAGTLVAAIIGGFFAFLHCVKLHNSLKVQNGMLCFRLSKI